MGREYSFEEPTIQKLQELKEWYVVMQLSDRDLTRIEWFGDKLIKDIDGDKVDQVYWDILEKTQRNKLRAALQEWISGIDQTICCVCGQVFDGTHICSNCQDWSNDDEDHIKITTKLRTPNWGIKNNEISYLNDIGKVERITKDDLLYGVTRFREVSDD